LRKNKKNFRQRNQVSKPRIETGCTERQMDVSIITIKDTSISYMMIVIVYQ